MPSNGRSGADSLDAICHGLQSDHVGASEAVDSEKVLGRQEDAPFQRVKK
jgi:hypothetical protein